MDSENADIQTIDQDYVNFKCVELMRIKALKKHGLQYFEPFVEKLKKEKKCDVDIKEFDSKLESAKQKILEVYSKEKSRQKNYNQNREKEEEKTQSNNIPIIAQPIPNIQGGILKIVCRDQAIQTDREWIDKIDSDAQKLKEMTAKASDLSIEMKSSNTQLKNKISRLEMQLNNEKSAHEELKTKNKRKEKDIKTLEDKVKGRDVQLEKFKESNKKWSDSYKTLKSEYEGQIKLLCQIDKYGCTAGQLKLNEQQPQEENKQRNATPIRKR